MKKKICAIIFVLVNSANAYFLNGEYLMLDKCSYEQVGYKYGYVGTYKGSGDKIYQIYFGSKYCEY